MMYHIKSRLAKPMQQHQQKISPSVHRPVGSGGHHVDPHHGSHSHESTRLQQEVRRTTTFLYISISFI